ncbi:MAG: glycosyltransferase [Lachnospiraceae bacterium]|nr:glycosyltransferase [Lachnospiraceae bacterium]
MNVCLLNDSFPPVIDGVANTVYNYARILEKDGLGNVLVGTPRYPDVDYDTYPFKVVAYRSIDTTKFVNGYRAGSPFLVNDIVEMGGFEPDIIHSHCPFVSTFIARELRTRCEAPIVFTYHTKFDVDIAKSVKAKFLRKEAVRALVSNISACDEVWVVSKGAGENLLSLGYEGEYRVVENGVDFPKGRVGEEEVRKVTLSYDLPENVPVFLFVGRMMKYKGLPLIIEALSMLDGDGVDFRMVFVGSGGDADEIKEMARAAGIYDDAGGKCIFTGPVYDREALRAWNTRADLFLFPSTYDTNGIVVREAAACALASVLIDGSCAAEGITNDRNGFIIDDDAGSMYELLKKLASDMPHMKQVGENAMNEIYISWETSVHAAYDLYNEVIENKKAGVYNTKRHRIGGAMIEFTDDVLYELGEHFKAPIRLIDNMFDDMLDNVGEIRTDIAWGLHRKK